ncbi:Ankyrin repeat-containing domain [Phytophthora cactorum]|nr:Ankyrin repeat-containing domain [Phytophthora cactorum]
MIYYPAYPHAMVDEAVVMQAASNGHIEILRGSDRNSTHFCLATKTAAAERGYLAVVQWLLEARGIQDTGVLTETHLHEAAARGGHLEVVTRLSLGSGSSGGGGISGRGRVLNEEWEEAKLESNRFSCRATSRAMDSAASNGHLEMVKWLHEHRDEGCTMDAMNRAAWNGHLDVVKWLHDHERKDARSKQ